MLLQILTDRCKEAKLARQAVRGASQPPPASLESAIAASEAACHVKSAPPELVKANGHDAEHPAPAAEDAASEPDSAYESAVGTPGVRSMASEYVEAESVVDGFTSDDSAVTLAPDDSKASKAWWQQLLLNSGHALPAATTAKTRAAEFHDTSEGQQEPSASSSGQNQDTNSSFLGSAPDAHGREAAGLSAEGPAEHGRPRRHSVDAHHALLWAALEQLPLTCEPVLQVR